MEVRKKGYTQMTLAVREEVGRGLANTEPSLCRVD